MIWFMAGEFAELAHVAVAIYSRALGCPAPSKGAQTISDSWESQAVARFFHWGWRRGKYKLWYMFELLEGWCSKSWFVVRAWGKHPHDYKHNSKMGTYLKDFLANHAIISAITDFCSYPCLVLCVSIHLLLDCKALTKLSWSVSRWILVFMA